MKQEDRSPEMKAVVMRACTEVLALETGWIQEKFSFVTGIILSPLGVCLCLPVSLNTHVIPKSEVFELTKEKKIEETSFKFSLSISLSLLCFTAHSSSLISLNFLPYCQKTPFSKEKINIYLEHKGNSFKGA